MPPHDDEATAMARQDILAVLDGQGAVGHGPIRLGGRVTARRDEPAAPAVAPETEPVEHGPVGHGTIRLGRTVVAGPPDDATTGAMHEIFAALNGDPTPGAY